ncbi:hypothetical protein HPP92_000098 [Vanilla planifolia]|uniref:Uncharacterized protein n=1 Tax=Vanilla planifolia TaxID=51239 RepID=A0A835S4Z3_VANPL|nr:hypothetical protein HPP92_000098 [Vanilla planifolia]
MRDVLDDLSSRLETLCVENPEPRVLAAPGESELEFKSAESSLSPPSVEEGREKGIQEFKRKSDRTNVRKENEGKKPGVVEGLFAQVVILDEEDDSEVVGSSEKSRSEYGEDAKDLVGDNSGDSIIMEGSGMSKTLRYRLPGKTANLLYPHQKEGLKWLWSLHCAGTGGILGDDMGLGKTMQVSTFLAGLFFSCLIRRVLVVAPKTLLGHWMKELTVVGLSSWIREYCGTSLRLREYELQKVFKEGGILLTTYDIVRNNSKSIRGDSYIDYNSGEDDVIWDYIILDEGHIIKNPQTQRAKSLFEIPSCHRIIISGTPIQNNLKRQLYEAFLKSDLVRSSVSGSPLAAITIFEKICDHPLLLTRRAAEGVLEGMDTMLNREELGMVEEMALNLANMSNHDDILKNGDNVSCKLSFIMSLLENLIKERHHVLIFSQTRKMLNLVQEAIISEGYKFLRIDGTTKAQDREKIVKDFQEGCGAPLFLLTSQVGGLGLTLTKADRVIVVDPAWNPSTDNQSVDRAYRIGQKRDVLVYRLMTCGTVEENIYKMQYLLFTYTIT